MSLSPSDIKALQTRLEALGFRLFVLSDYGQDNQWFHIAIREFQIYASMDVTATVKDPSPDRWAARLVQTQFTDTDKQNKYTGPIDGLRCRSRRSPRNPATTCSCTRSRTTTKTRWF